MNFKSISQHRSTYLANKLDEIHQLQSEYSSRVNCLPKTERQFKKRYKKTKKHDNNQNNLLRAWPFDIHGFGMVLLRWYIFFKSPLSKDFCLDVRIFFHFYIMQAFWFFKFQTGPVYFLEESLSTDIFYQKSSPPPPYRYQMVVPKWENSCHEPIKMR